VELALISAEEVGLEYMGTQCWEKTFWSYGLFLAFDAVAQAGLNEHCRLHSAAAHSDPYGRNANYISPISSP